MKISLLNERLTIQKNSVTVDSVGNHKKRMGGLLLLLYLCGGIQLPTEGTAGGGDYRIG